MPRVKHVSNGVVRHVSVGRSSPGDVHVVTDEAAAYLCDDRGDFERTDEAADEVRLGDDEYSVAPADEIDYTSIPPNLDDCTYDELYDIASDHDIDGRSGMTKDELIDALSE